MTSNENHSTDDSDSESETFMNVPESEWLDKNIATVVAHTVYTSNADSVTGLNSAEIDSAEIDDSVDDVNIQGPGGNPTLKGDVDGFVSVASTTVSSAEVDRSSVLSDDSSDVTAMDELDDTALMVAMMMAVSPPKSPLGLLMSLPLFRGTPQSIQGLVLSL